MIGVFFVLKIGGNMGYDGYLLKMGNDIFPTKFVFKESYEITPNQMLDVNPTTNANGKLKRTVLEHMPSIISFQTKPMWNNDLKELMSFIRNHYLVEKEKKLIITYYCPDIDEYKTGEFYVPNIVFPVYLIDNKRKRIFYNGFQLKFIEY